MQKHIIQNGEFEKAAEFLNKTTLAESWTDFAKNEYKRKNNDKVKYYVEYGLKDHAAAAKNEDVYEIIDNYIALFPTRKEGISALASKDYSSTGADYISYLNCNEVVENNLKEACF